MSSATLHWAWVQRLPPVEKLVLLALANNVSDGEWHHYNRLGVASFVGIDESRLFEALNYLRRAGSIERRDEGTLDLVRLAFSGRDAEILFVKPLASGDHEEKKQHVYFVRSRDLIKIGYSTEPDRRFKALRTTWPHPIKILKVVPGGKRLEAEYHERFAHLRKVGEWFKAEPELVGFIETLEGVTA